VSCDPLKLDHLSPSQKGDVAEAYITAELCRLGYEVLKPVSSACRYDLAVAFGAAIIRLQCKLGNVDRNAIRFWASSSRRQRDGGLVKADYTADCDLLVCYCHQTQECYAIAACEAPATMASLMLQAPLNNQTTGVRFARDHILRDVLKNLIKGP
jgi:hypothetical protein